VTNKTTPAKKAEPAETQVIDNTDAAPEVVEEAKIASEVEIGFGIVQVNYV
jgi:hypothetical protein